VGKLTKFLNRCVALSGLGWLLRRVLHGRPLTEEEFQILRPFAAVSDATRGIVRKTGKKSCENAVVAKFVVNHVRGRMWLPLDVDLQEVDWSPLKPDTQTMGIERTTRRARPTSNRIPYGHAIRKMLSVK